MDTHLNFGMVKSWSIDKHNRHKLTLDDGLGDDEYEALCVDAHKTIIEAIQTFEEKYSHIRNREYEEYEAREE